MATLQITKRDRVSVFEVDAQGGADLEVGRGRDGLPCLVFGGYAVSDGHRQLGGVLSIDEACEVLNGLEQVQAVSINGSTVWSEAGAIAARERDARAALDEAGEAEAEARKVYQRERERVYKAIEAGDEKRRAGKSWAAERGCVRAALDNLRDAGALSTEFEDECRVWIAGHEEGKDES